MELRKKILINDLGSDHILKIVGAMDDVVYDIGDVTISAVANVMARLCDGLDEQRACA